MRVESRQVVGSDSHRNSCTALTSSPEKKGGQSRRQGPIAHKAARVHAAGGPPKAAHGTPMVNSPFQLVHGMDQLLAQHNAGQPAVGKLAPSIQMAGQIPWPWGSTARTSIRPYWNSCNPMDFMRAEV